jgi:hypothetical protein
MENNPAELFQSLIAIVVLVVLLASWWKLFTKANWPGWASIIPIYNLYVIFRIAGKSGWLLILMLVPFVNFIVLIIVELAFAKRFGKGVGFGLGLIFLGFVFYPILAFGDAKYIPPTDE